MGVESAKELEETESLRVWTAPVMLKIWNRKRNLDAV